MKKNCLILTLSALATMTTTAQEAVDTTLCTLVVADAERKIPLRDILIYTDDGQDTRSRWDGTFALRQSFRRISFRHPNFQSRYVLAGELRGDTIWLLPTANRLDEVIIYGVDRRKDHMSALLTPSPQQLQRDKMPKVIPAGPNILAILAWGFDKLFSPRIARKKALKEHRLREAEAAKRYDNLLSGNKENQEK